MGVASVWLVGGDAEVTLRQPPLLTVTVEQSKLSQATAFKMSHVSNELKWEWRCQS